MNSLDTLGYRAYEIAEQHGFWKEEKGPSLFLAKMALMHSEISEILEAYRKQQGAAAIEEEFADLIIRMVDLYEGMRLVGVVENSLQATVAEKMMKNSSRPHMHDNLI